MGVGCDYRQRTRRSLGACGTQSHFLAESSIVVVYRDRQTSVFVQAGLGVVMVNRDKRVFPQFHAFYGFVAIIAIATIYSYREQLKSRLYLLYGFGGLFIMGLAIRAVLVG